MNKKAVIIGFAVGVALLSLTGCDDKPATIVYDNPAPAQVQQAQVVQEQPQVVYQEQQEPQVVVVQQQPSYSSSGGLTAGHLAAGALGYMAGKHLGRSSYGSSYRPRRSVVHHHYHSSPRRSFYGRSRRR